MRPGTCFKITPVSRGELIYIMISCLVVFEKSNVSHLRFVTQCLVQDLVHSGHILIALQHNGFLVNMSNKLRIEMKSNFEILEDSQIVSINSNKYNSNHI